MDNANYKKFLKIQGPTPKLDPEAIERDASYDGMYVLTSNTKLSGGTLIETYKGLLTLKILWGWSAAFGIIISYDYWPKFGALILLTFIVFPSAWLYYKFKLGKK